MDALYNFLSGGANLSPLNAALLIVVFFLARQRWQAIIGDVECAQKRLRQLEMTLVKHGMTLVREEEE